MKSRSYSSDNLMVHVVSVKFIGDPSPYFGCPGSLIDPGLLLETFRASSLNVYTNLPRLWNKSSWRPPFVLRNTIADHLDEGNMLPHFIWTIL